MDYQICQAIRGDISGKWYICKGSFGWGYSYLNSNVEWQKDPELFDSKDDAEEVVALYMLVKSAQSN